MIITKIDNKNSAYIKYYLYFCSKITKTNKTF